MLTPEENKTYREWLGELTRLRNEKRKAGYETEICNFDLRQEILAEERAGKQHG